MEIHFNLKDPHCRDSGDEKMDEERFLFTNDSDELREIPIYLLIGQFSSGSAA
jgi:hypothetical protein